MKRHNPSRLVEKKQVARPAGFEPLESRFLLFAVPIHIELTNEALPFLNTQTAATIAAEQAIVDTIGAFDDANHFDNSKFVESVANINEQLGEALADANPADLDPILAAGNFGHGLHTVEDFYAHSNWVELGQTTLFDDSTGYWLNPTPYSLRDGVMIVQGPSPYGPGSVSRVGPIVTVNTGTASYPGLITGQYGSSPADAPPEAVISHDELNKDSPDKPLHAEARALAVEQIRHEFYRLIDLVQQTYGTAQPLLDAWVKSDAVSQQQVQELLGSKSLSLGSVSSDGTLTLNMGPAASGRGAFVDATDGDESFTITHVSGSPTAEGEVVEVAWGGFTQQFTVRSIAASGGSGNDVLTLVGVQAPASFVGGDGNDRLEVIATGSTADQVVVTSTEVSLNGSATQSSAVEAVVVDPGGGADRIEVRSTSPAATVKLLGNAGDDEFLLGNADTVDGIRSSVAIDGGAGINSVTLLDAADTTADVLTLTPTTIGAASGDNFFGVGGSVSYSGIASIVVNMPSAVQGDTIRVTPSATTAFTIKGNSPTQTSRYRDLLLIDTTGLSKQYKQKISNTAGAWLFEDRLPVSFTGIESVKKL